MVVGRDDMSTKLKAEVFRWLNIVQCWLLPGVCILCQRNTGEASDLCLPCRAQLLPVSKPCQGCGLPVPESASAGLRCGRCLGTQRPISTAVMRFAWSQPASGLISQFKYQRKLQYGRVLTALLADQIRCAYAGLPLPELLVPVPLHPRKLRARGYNQSLLIARQLGKALQLPVSGSLLQRVRHTPPQQGLSARQRKRNLQGAFALNVTERELLAQVRTIALVDDVVTTMTTATTLARTLQAHTNTPIEVHLWALARA
jgi:ComF family protein